jgi:hypothetical protein
MPTTRTGKQIAVEMPIAIPKSKVVRYEVEDAKESNEPVTNIYISKKALAEIGNPDAIEIIIRPLS